MDKAAFAKRLAEAADVANKSGDFDAGVTLLELYGRVQGYFIERRLVIHDVIHDGITEQGAIDYLSGGDPTFAEALRRIVQAHKQRGEFHVVS